MLQITVIYDAGTHYLNIDLPEEAISSVLAILAQWLITFAFKLIGIKAVVEISRVNWLR
jgi:hypothetical protein